MNDDPKILRRASLKKYMPPVLGWDRLTPLPEQFTALPDPDWESRDKRMMIVNPEMEKLIMDGRPTVIDLFSGCGGFSLGFIEAGWRVIASVEWMYWAHVTYCCNIPHRQEAPLHCYSCDIRKLSGREILANAGVTEVDAIIGGPPCQSFSTCGKREIGDERDTLLWQFGRLVKEIQPKTYIMENVPGLKSKKFANGKLVIEEWQKYMESKTISDFQSLLTKEVMENKTV